MQTQTHQTCTICKSKLKLSKKNFYKCKSETNGFNNICKQCIKKRRQKWEKKNNYKEPNFVDKCKGDEFLARARVIKSGITSRARQKNIFVDRKITTNYILNLLKNNLCCKCCGVKMDFSFKEKKYQNNNSPTIDRLDPNKGYMIKNIRVLCYKCNVIKGNSTLKELETVYKWMMKR